MAFVGGRRRSLGRYAGATERGNEVYQLFTGLLIDIGELDPHAGEQEKAFRLIAGPGHLGFGLVFFPRAVGKGEFDR